MNKSLTIGGMTIGTDTITSVFNSIISGFAGGSSASDIVSTIEQDALSAVESVLNFMFPGVGTGISLIENILKILGTFTTQPLTQDQVNAWMDQFGAGSQS